MDNVDTIYLDNQATTRTDPRVLAKMAVAWGDGFGNPHSAEHCIGWRAAASVDASALAVGALVGADQDEVIFTSGATEANNLALLGLRDQSQRSGRRRILMSAIEHKSVLAAGRYLSDCGECELVLIGVDRDGLIDLPNLTRQLDDDALLVSVMAVNNEIGVIQDIAAIGKLAAKAGALFHCDAAQAPCAFDTRDLLTHADLISLSAHKLYGPSGIGALVVRRDVQSILSPLIHGGGQQNGLRSGTVPLPLCAGFGAAVELLCGDEARRERERVGVVRDLFIAALAELCVETRLNGAAGDLRHPGNANLLFSSAAAADVIAAMQPFVAASSGSACTSGIPEPSHVLKAMGLTSDEADRSVRFSFGRYSTEDDARRAALIVNEAVARVSEPTRP